MSHDFPTVTVLMPVHNGARYLRSALRSIRRQTLRDYEFVIVDDGSTDATARMLQRAAANDARIRVITRPNTGIVDALNAGLAVARAPLIARMDADDICQPTRLAVQAEFLASESQFLGCGSAVSLIDRTGSVVDYVCRSPDPATIDDALMRGDRHAVIHPSLMVRREALEAVGGYRKFAQFEEDLDLFLRLTELGDLTNLPQHLLQHRVHFEATHYQYSDAAEAITEAVLRDACRRRGLAFKPEQLGVGAVQLAPARQHLEWAVSASRLGRRLTALRHALVGTTLAPTDRTCYTTLRTVFDQLVHRPHGAR